jgi:hypothetical protein
MMRQAMEQRDRQKRIGTAVGGIVPPQYAQLAQDAPELALGLMPKPEALPSDVQGYEYAVRQSLQGNGPHPGTYQDWVSRKTREGATQIINTPENKAAVAESVELAKSNVAWADAARATADNAARQMAQLQIIRGAKLPTGALEPLKANILSVAKSAGITLSPEKQQRISGAQSYQALTQSLVNDVLMAAKGPQTEGDAKRAAQIMPSLSNEAQANEFISGYMMNMRQREIEQSQFLNDWQDKNESLKGARSAWDKYRNETPLVAVNSKGVPVFFYDWMDAAKQANPNMTREQLLSKWREYSGGR